MKRFVAKVQNLSQKAAEIQKAIQGVPPKIAELRESVAMTATQLHQLRAGVQSTVSDLRMDNPDHIVEALQEINDHAAVFEQAGYSLAGIDMELSPVQRLMVHLEKFEDVPHATVRSLIAAHQSKRTLHALLSSLLQAEAVADRVALSELTYRTLVVHVGPIPSVRLCWRAEVEEPAASGTLPAHVPAVTSSPALPAATSSPFAQSSFFETRSSPTPAASPAAIDPAAATASLTTTIPEPAVSTASTSQPQVQSSEMDWKKEALERLKKNPHASKYRN